MSEDFNVFNDKMKFGAEANSSVIDDSLIVYDFVRTAEGRIIKIAKYFDYDTMDDTSIDNDWSKAP